MTEEIPGFVRIEALTDEAGAYWFKYVFNEAPVDLRHQVSEIIEKHKHHPDRDDPAGSVQTYVHEVMSDLRRLGCADCLLAETQAKNVINKMNYIRPTKRKDLLFWTN